MSPPLEPHDGGKTMTSDPSPVRAGTDVAGRGSTTGDGKATRDDESAGRATGRRRHVRSVLSRESPPIDVGTVALKVAIREASIAAEKMTEQSVQEVRDSLDQEHLPRLAAAGLVEYDGEAGCIDATADEIETPTG